MRRKYHRYHTRIIAKQERKDALALAMIAAYVVPMVILGAYLMPIVTASAAMLPMAEDKPETYRDYTAGVQAYYVPSAPSQDLDAPQARVDAPRPLAERVHGTPSQAQKDATAIACAHAWERHMTALQEAKISRGEYMTDCFGTLLAIAKHESNFNDNARNESSIEHSYGAFQINLDVHRHITREQAEDFTFAVNWTIERLHSFNYPINRTLSIVAHNGITYHPDGRLNTERYADKVKATAERFKKSL